jgi:coiled-coil domain-containing protein 12
MGESAAERRARLKKLREVAFDGDDVEDDDNAKNDDGGDKNEEDVMRTAIKLRNYVPKDIASLEGRAEILPNAVAPEFNIIDEAAKRNGGGDGGVDDENDREEEAMTTTSLPKKQNWDLKRDVAKKMEKLERQTNRAIAELAREEEERRENN